MAPNIPNEMMAAQVVEFNKPYKIHKVPVPKVGPNDVLVKVAVGSLCHTDSMVSSGLFHGPVPCTASHEGSGTVAAIGKDVTKFKVGDRVMCGIVYGPCGKCGDCTGPEKYKQYCQNVKILKGVTGDGYWAEYAIIGEEFSAKLPDEVSFETAAPMACAGITIWRAVLAAEEALMSKDGWLAILGSGGGLGHLGIQFAKSKGLKVIGLDARDEGLKLSKKYGADVVVDVRKGDQEAVKEVQKVTGGPGADVTITLSDAKTAATTACAVTRMHGTMIQVAQPDQVSVPFREIVFRDIRIHGSLMSSPKEAEEMLQVVGKEKITVTANKFDGLDKIPELLELAHSGKMAGKGMIIVDQEQIKEEQKNGAKLA